MANPIATLTVRLSAQIAEFQKSFQDTSGTLKKFTHEFEGVATKAAAVGSFFGTIAADIAKSMAAGFGRAISNAVRLSSEFSNSLIGLSSVSRAFGVDADAAKAAARGLSADGLMPLKDSATGLKNLLAAGFNLDQSINLMNAFKDSAAFGRQGALSFGDAVRSATEGVKNGNSILVDNAGVTKNLSQILKEAGFSAQDLSRASSDAAVRMALYNGILKETRAQTGDAQRLTMTYTGQVSRLGAAFDSVLATIGSAITENKTVALAIQAVGDAFADLNTMLVQNRNAFNLVSDAVIFVARSLSMLLSAVDLVQTGFNGLIVTVSEWGHAMLSEMARVLAPAAAMSQLAAKVLPGAQWQQQATLATAALVIVGDQQKKLSNASEEATQRSIRFGNAIQGGVAKLDALAAKLAASRGQTVDLGEATRGTTSAINENSDAVGKNVRLLSEQTQVQNLLAKARAHETARLQIETAAWAAWQRSVSDALTNLPTAIFKTRNLSGIVPQVDASGAGNLAGASTPGSGLIASLFGTPQQLGQQMAATIVGAFQGGGNAVKSAVGQLGSTVAGKFAEMVKADGTKLFQGALGSIFSGALPVIGSLIGPLVSKVWGALFGTAGRDTKLDLVRRHFGSVEEMQQQLLTLSGPEYNRLWKQFSEVGQNNKNQAIAAVEAIVKALDAQKRKQEEVTAATKASVDAQEKALDEIAAKYKTKIDEIDTEYKRLSDSVAKEAAEEHMGITETLEREEMKRLEDKKKALEAERDAEIAAKKETFAETLTQAQDLDGKLREMFERGYKIPMRFHFPDGIPPVYDPSTLPAGMTGGYNEWETAAPASGGSRPIVIQNRLTLDGRVVARNQVTHMPDALGNAGL